MKEGKNVINNNTTVNQPKILTGTDDFKTLLLNSEVFVDKSLLIKEVTEDSASVILITRPRRWGKSLNMDMIEKFLTIEVDSQGNLLPQKQRINNKLFVGGEIDLGFGETKKLKPLKISNDINLMKRQGQFPVIFISFKDVKGGSYQEIVEGIRSQIIKTYGRHKYLEQYLEKDNKLLTSDQKEQLTKYFNGKLDNINLKNSLGFLSEVLFNHFGQKAYILIDEYDTPINSAYLKFGDKSDEFEQVLELFRGVFGITLKSNPYLEKGMLTGILRIAKANLFSDLNNVREYTLLDKKFAKFYGFTQEEVDELLIKVPTITIPEKIKDWYNGYTFGGEIIYNPWSIMLCLSSGGELDHYWLDSGGTGLVDKALLSDEIQEELQELLEGRGIVKKLYKQISFKEIENNTDIFYSLLVFAGYLNPSLANDDDEYPRYRLTIPNKEVRNIYVERVISWVTNKLNIKVSDYDDFIGLLTDQKIDKFKQKFSEYLMNSTSYHDLIKEKDYHNLIGGILAPLTRGYMIESNRESGHGRFDHMLIPRENRGYSAIIIEYKVSETIEDLLSTARTGLNQIINKNYAARIKEHQHVKNILNIAMAFCGKKIELQYQIDNIR
jgi:Predicted AAA-ATPase/PD-(D/E)XK nuclease superfamily